MKIIKPSVTLIRPPMYENLLSVVEQAGRVCYKSEDRISDGSAEVFVRNIIKRGHEAVLEHGSITVKFVCDRGVSHEIVRHRLASYCQESTRYCNYSGDKFGAEISVVDLATGFRYDLNNPKDRAKYNEWTEAMEDAERHYMSMIELGATPQEARSVLPCSVKTEVFMTANIREWRHFSNLRCATSAHPQIREVADMVKDLFVGMYPVFFEDLGA